MKCNLVNYFLLSSILLGVLDIGFFVYTSTTLYDLQYLRHSIHCSSYYNYCVYTSLIFLLSILVVLSFVCFTKDKPLIPLFMVLANIGFNLGIGIDNFVNKDTLCDNNCRIHCPDLNNYGDIFTIFMITNLCCLGVILIGSIVFCVRYC